MATMYIASSTSSTKSTGNGSDSIICKQIHHTNYSVLIQNARITTHMKSMLHNPFMGSNAKFHLKKDSHNYTNAHKGLCSSSRIFMDASSNGGRTIDRAVLDDVPHLTDWLPGLEVL